MATTGMTIKVLMVGPVKSGKSTLTNFLCGTRDTATTRYYPTEPLRIVEMEADVDAAADEHHYMGGFASGHGIAAPVGGAVGRRRRVVVQVWDVSGNSKYQACWPAIANKADAIVYVFSPDVANAEKELVLWHKNFALRHDELDEHGNYATRVPPEHCLVFAHHSTPPAATAAATRTTASTSGQRGAEHTTSLPAMPKPLERVRCVETSLDYQSDNFKEVFDKLIERVVAARANAEASAQPTMPPRNADVLQAPTLRM